MKKIIIGSVGLLFVGIMFLFSYKQPLEKTNEKNSVAGTVIAMNDEEVTLQDSENIIYTFQAKDLNVSLGDHIVLSFLGILDKNKEKQENEIVEYTVSTLNEIELDKNDLFGSFYEKAQKKLDSMTLDEKIGQVLMLRFDESNIENTIKNYLPGGFVFYAKDFENKTEAEVKNMIETAQRLTKIPLLTAVDEEGGKIIRVSSNPNLVSEPFKSSSELYLEGGLNLIRQDTIFKSAVLKNLGLNVNLAPVVDVVSSPDAYMYERSLKQDTEKTSEYAKTVIEASKNSGVSYTLKHFPGYGNNSDTHLAEAVDTRNLEDLKKNDFPPFASGIESGAEAVLVSHNIITNVDSTNPASLSKSIHNLLRNELKFTGIIITDDISMNALNETENKAVLALLAGNDLLITSDYEESFQEIKKALANNNLSETTVNNAALRVLAWKYYKGLIIEQEK